MESGESAEGNDINKNGVFEELEEEDVIERYFLRILRPNGQRSVIPEHSTTLAKETTPTAAE